MGSEQGEVSAPDRLWDTAGVEGEGRRRCRHGPDHRRHGCIRCWHARKQKYRRGGTKDHRGGAMDHCGRTMDHRGRTRDRRGGTTSGTGETTLPRWETPPTRPAMALAKVRTMLPSSDGHWRRKALESADVGCVRRAVCIVTYQTLPKEPSGANLMSWLRKDRLRYTNPTRPAAFTPATPTDAGACSYAPTPPLTPSRPLTILHHDPKPGIRPTRSGHDRHAEPATSRPKPSPTPYNLQGS
jgi:hypothetical protein